MEFRRRVVAAALACARRTGVLERWSVCVGGLGCDSHDNLIACVDGWA